MKIDFNGATCEQGQLFNHHSHSNEIVPGLPANLAQCTNLTLCKTSGPLAGDEMGPGLWPRINRIRYIGSWPKRKRCPINMHVIANERKPTAGPVFSFVMYRNTNAVECQPFSSARYINVFNKVSYLLFESHQDVKCR